MKSTNPLYVVKGDQVEAAENFFDLIIKKLNLSPVIEILTYILKLLLENIKTYSAFIIAKDFLDLLISKIELFKKYSIV
jgi:hypothetical protein